MQAGAVRSNRVQLEIVVPIGGEHNGVAFWGPRGKVVVMGTIGKRDNFAIGYREDHQLLAALVDDAFAVGGPAREAIVETVFRDLLVTGAVRFHQSNLCGRRSGRPEVGAYRERDHVARGGPDAVV